MSYPLGRLLNHDPRNRDHPYLSMRVTWESARHTRHIPVTDQGTLGSCTGHAGIGAVGTGVTYVRQTDAKKKTLKNPNGTAVDVYSKATKIDPFDGKYPPNDTGSDGVSVCKVLKTQGFITRYQWCFTLNQALIALTDRPVMLGLPWQNDMFTPDDDGRLQITGGVAGGHEICADQIDAGNLRVWITNSWGPEWGQGGRAYLTFADLATLLDNNGDVCVPIK